MHRSADVVGNVWTVGGPVGAFALAIAGPFPVVAGGDEFVVAPLYSARQPGFIPTVDDVLVSLNGEKYFAALWNARPLLRADLERCIGAVSTHDLESVRDAYWGRLDGSGAHPGVKTGHRLRWWRRRRVVRFQEQEIGRWASVSGKALAANLGCPGPREPVLACIQAVVDGRRGTWVGGMVRVLLNASVGTIRDEEDIPAIRLVTVSGRGGAEIVVRVTVQPPLVSESAPGGSRGAHRLAHEFQDAVIDPAPIWRPIEQVC